MSHILLLCLVDTGVKRYYAMVDYKDINKKLSLHAFIIITRIRGIALIPRRVGHGSSYLLLSNKICCNYFSHVLRIGLQLIFFLVRLLYK